MKLIILLAALVLGGCCAISTVGVDLQKTGGDTITREYLPN